MATREQLHQLVSSLPEHSIDAAHVVLTQLQDAPSLAPNQVAALDRFRRAQQQVHDRLQERMQEMVYQLARRNPR